MFTTIPPFRKWLRGCALVASAVTAHLMAPQRLQAQATTDSLSTRALLDGYVQEALAANLAIAQQHAAVRRADAALREARGRFLPAVDLNARYSEFSGVVNIGDFINPAYSALNQLLGQPRFPTDVSATLPFRQESKLELTLPLYNGALFGARAAARAQRDLAGSTRRAAMRQLAADVQQAWLGYATAVRAVETLDATMAVLNENVRVSERLIANGQATPDVLLRARAERSELEQQRADAARQRDVAKRGFNLLRNAPDNADVRLVDDSTLLASVNLVRDELVTAALRQREELAQSASGLAIAKAQQRVSDAAFLPNVALAASYGIQGDRYRFDRNNDVGLASVVLSWNLFNGTQDAARREQAAATRTEAEIRQREAERSVRMHVLNAADAVETARLSLTAADDRDAAAQRAFFLVQRRYAEGLATPIEFLSARSSATAAALNRLITRFAYASRIVELERAAALRALPN